ncbi:MAG: tetratricopeptide repeat protein [Dehalococcoidia bacterium]|nr:MAG: tetratricopeptide repeat protein [Dehalococcoidia bacterium]
MVQLGSLVQVLIRQRLLVIVGVLLLGAGTLAGVQAMRPDEPTFSGFDTAIVDLEERVRANPQDVDARLAVALAYGERGLNQRAAEQFEEALLLAPNNVIALVGLGKVRFELKDYAAAEQALKQAVESEATNEQRLTLDQLQEAEHFLSRVYVELRQYDAAAASARDALKINGSDADTWRVLGDIEQKGGNYEAAEQAYMSAISFVPDYREVYTELDRLYAATKRNGARQWAQGMVLLADQTPAKAVPRLEDAVRLEPGFAEAHQGLGMAYESTGRLEDALASYRRALELSPGLFLSTDAVRRLEAKISTGNAR